MQKFFRAAIQTNDIDGLRFGVCVLRLHSYAMQRYILVQERQPISVDDLKDTNCILVIGAIPTDGHPVTVSKIQAICHETKFRLHNY